MGRQLRLNVYVRDDDGNTVWFHPGDEPPKWAAKKITNPKVWEGDAEEEDEEDAESDSEPPPQAGRGASGAAWADYARSAGVDVPEDASRDEIIAACEKAGVPTER